MAVTNRAARRKHEGLTVCGTLIEQNLNDLRDHITRTLDDDRIANADVLARDFIFIVQGRIGDDDAADRHRLQLGDRG